MKDLRTSDTPFHQLSRQGLLWLLTCCAACALLLARFLPWWVMPVCAVCMLWRLLIFQGRLPFPSRLLKALLVVASCAALFWQFGKGISLEFFVALLLLAFALKLLEVYRRTDAQYLLYLALFVLMVFFLFEQGAGFALLAFAAVLLTVAALVAINAGGAILVAAPGMPWRRAAGLFLIAVPLMLCLFVVMPRLPPLWVMPLQKQQARTGMSDEMSPGDISSLARSSELVFRATFTGAVPAQRDLYWRGLLLDSFDGKTWRDSCAACTQGWQRSDQLPDAVSGQRYEMMLEPHGRHWLYVLEPSAVHDRLVWRHENGIFRTVKPLNERQVFLAEWLPTSQQVVSLPENDRLRYLALPATGNARARALAVQWHGEEPDEQALIQRALSWFAQSFHYTLEPPVLSEQRIDDFLFVTQRGFCEHFAGSFVFLMRAAGVPARVVLGYMGGETRATERYVVVRQHDAHAWAEVWLDGKGWQRVDPTAAVSPERIEFSLIGGQVPLEAFDAGVLSWRGFNDLRLQFQHLDYLWAYWVLGYEAENQQALLRKLGLLSPWRLALWFAGITLAAFSLLWFYLWWLRRQTLREHPLTQQYRALCVAYAGMGVVRAPSETPLQFAGRVQATVLPYADDFAIASSDYSSWLYGGTHAFGDPALLARMMWRLRLRLFMAGCRRFFARR